jgi:hypothetical protein
MLGHCVRNGFGWLTKTMRKSRGATAGQAKLSMHHLQARVTKHYIAQVKVKEEEHLHICAPSPLYIKKPSLKHYPTALATLVLGKVRYQFHIANSVGHSQSAYASIGHYTWFVVTCNELSDMREETHSLC